MSTTYCWKMQGEERRREGLHVDSAGRPGSGVLVSLTPELTLHHQRVPDKCAFLVESLSISSDQVPWTGQEKKEG